MNKAQQERELDNFSRQIIRKAGMETPSGALKSAVMAAVQAEKPIRTEIKGLLGIRGKVAIGSLVTGFCIAIGFLPQSRELWEVSEFFGQLSGILERLSHQIPSTFFYGILTLGILLGVQIAYLKYRLSRF